jgi:hypothetical protein
VITTLNTAQTEAIATADAHTNNANLSTYSDLMKSVGVLLAITDADYADATPEEKTYRDQAIDKARNQFIQIYI